MAFLCPSNLFLQLNSWGLKSFKHSGQCSSAFASDLDKHASQVQRMIHKVASPGSVTRVLSTRNFLPPENLDISCGLLIIISFVSSFLLLLMSVNQKISGPIFDDGLMQGYSLTALDSFLEFLTLYEEVTYL